MHRDFASPGQVQHFDYRPAIDGLRGVAVLAVLGFHAFPGYMPGGFVGVDVFFVISGFLITGIIARQLQREEFSYIEFYARRVRRLFPALVLVLGVTVALGWLVLLPDEFRLLGKHIAAAALFVANLAFWRESGYFDVIAEFKPLLHLWSLGIEEQFYLLWPLLLVSLWKRGPVLLLVLATLVVASFTASVVLSHTAPVAAFYSPFSRFWELGLGCLLALCSSFWPKLQDPRRRHAAYTALFEAAPLVGLALIVSTIFLFDENTLFPSWRALLPVAGTLLILATPEHAWFQRRILGSRTLVYIGLISYALYLWHWPLLSFANILHAGLPPTAVRWSVLVASFVLASATYHFVEVPIRRRKGLRVNFGLITGAVAACITGFIVYTTFGVPSRFDVDVQALRHGPRVDPSCRARFSNADRINYCRTTDEQPPDIVILGDSRAQAVYEAAAPLFEREHSVMLLGRGGCPPVLNVIIRGYDPNEADCPEIWRTFVDYVQSTKPAVVVIVGNGSFLLTRDKIHLARVGAKAAEPKERVLEYGLNNLMSELTRSSHVVYVGEIPGFDTAPSCFLRPVQLPTTHCSPTIDRQRVDSAMSPYNDVLNRVRQTFPRVRFVDSVNVLCTETECSQWPADQPVLYSDAIHLSPAGGRLLVDEAHLGGLIAEGMRVAVATQ